MSEKINIRVILQDECVEDREAYNIEDILGYENIEAFIQNFSKEKPVNYDAAYKILLSDKSRKIYDAIRELRKIEILNVDVFFITPIGLFHDTDFMVPYKECIEKIPTKNLALLFEEVNLVEEVSKILFDRDVDIFVIALDAKLLQLLKFENLLQENRKYFLIVDKPYFPKVGDVIVFYPSYYVIEKLKELSIKPRLDRFKIDSFLVITKLLISSLETYDNLETVLGEIKSINDVIDFLKTKTKQIGDISKLVQVSGYDILILNIPKRKIKTTLVNENIAEKNVYLVDEALDLNLDKIREFLEVSDFRAKVVFMVNKNIRLQSKDLSKLHVDYEIVKLNDPQPIEIEMEDNKKLVGWVKEISHIEEVGEKIVLIVYPTQYLEKNIEGEKRKIGYILKLDEIDTCQMLDCRGDILIVKTEKQLSENLDSKFGSLLRNFKWILIFDDSWKLIRIYGEGRKEDETVSSKLKMGSTLNEVLSFFLGK